MKDEDIDNLAKKIIDAVESFGVRVGPPHPLYGPKANGLRAYVERESHKGFLRPEKYRTIDFRVVLEDEGVD